MALPQTPNQTRHSDAASTARAFALEPRRAVLRSLHAWAADQSIDPADLAAFKRVLKQLASAEHGPDLDFVMRAARCRVINQARRRPHHSGAS